MASAQPITQIEAAKPYAWPYDASFSKETTALVIIDMQHDFCSEDGYLAHQGHDTSIIRAIIPALQKLLYGFREKGWKVYHTREGHRPDLSTLSMRELHRSNNKPTLGSQSTDSPLPGKFLIRGTPNHDIIPELYPKEGEPIIDKPGKGAFTYTDFELLLKNRGIKNLIIGGATTDVCVSSTVREATDRGFDVAILADGCAAAEQDMHDAALKSVMGEGGIFGTVVRVEDVLAALGL